MTKRWGIIMAACGIVMGVGVLLRFVALVLTLTACTDTAPAARSCRSVACCAYMTQPTMRSMCIMNGGCEVACR